MKKEFNVYFWNGFGKPEKMATSITGLLRNVTISDNYTGDVTTDMRQEIRYYKSGKQSYEDMIYGLSSFDLYVNPTLETFKEVSRRWFDTTPMHLLTEFE